MRLPVLGSSLALFFSLWVGKTHEAILGTYAVIQPVRNIASVWHDNCKRLDQSKQTFSSENCFQGVMQCQT